jgi:hypothetical protein
MDVLERVREGVYVMILSECAHDDADDEDEGLRAEVELDCQDLDEIGYACKYN